MLQSMRSAAKYIWIILIVAFVGSFLLYETSGLAGRAPVTTTTSIATVNGEEILNILLTDIRSTYNSKRAALGAAGMDVRQFPVLGGGGVPNINFTPSR